MKCQCKVKPISKELHQCEIKRKNPLETDAYGYNGAVILQNQTS